MKLAHGLVRLAGGEPVETLRFTVGPLVESSSDERRVVERTKTLSSAGPAGRSPAFTVIADGVKSNDWPALTIETDDGEPVGAFAWKPLGFIVGTVAVGPTYTDLGILALLVVIRTFLSFSLELEITGRWPWQHDIDSPKGQ